MDKRLCRRLGRLRELASPLERHAEEVWVRRTRISREFTEKLTGSSTPAFRSKAEVAGRLERLDVHGRHQFGLFPPLGGKVTCEFEPELLAKVLKLLLVRSMLWARLNIANYEPYPQRVQVTAMEFRPHDDELHSFPSRRWRPTQ